MTANGHKAKTILEQAGYICTNGGLSVFDIIAENPLGIRHIKVDDTVYPEVVETLRMQLPKNSTIEQWAFRNGKPKIKFL